MKKSIQNRLFLLAGLVFLATWIGAAQISNTQGFRNTQAILEREVARTAELILRTGVSEVPTFAKDNAQEHHYLGIWIDGRQNFVLGPELAWPQSDAPTFNQFIDGTTWVFAKRCEKGRCVVSGAAHTKRHQNLYCLIASIFGPLFLILLAGFAGMLGAIQHALRPIKALANSVAKIEVERPDSLAVADPAAEFLPLVYAINGLSARVRKLLDRERMFLGSCAHEIRTPLTGLIGQLQMNERDGLENVRVCAERTARVADQFLTFASSKSLYASQQNAEQFDLCEAVRAAIAPIVENEQKLELEMTGLQHLFVEAHPFAISTIASNLIQNALNYARGEGTLVVRLSVQVREGQAQIVLSDNGPGIAAEERSKVCREFARLSRGRASAGAGLGLSIVQEIVAQYRGTLTLDRCPVLHGLRVEIILPICALAAEDQEKTSETGKALCVL